MYIIPHAVTINIPIFYMVLFVMWANPFRGSFWKGWALKIETFLGPKMAISKASAICSPKSQDFQGPPLPMALVMDLPLSKFIKSKCHIKTGTLIFLCTWVLLATV
jgi:hypothetical protein